MVGLFVAGGDDKLPAVPLRVGPLKAGDSERGICSSGGGGSTMTEARPLAKVLVLSW